ncbi:hypothetical protein LOC68_20965 [Blastopirellula sp. JC732]|uniref:Cytochrome c domain-containing protein n=1 Tax=Blastopirellula sediminis TaxID=2894196 RepID=A0A9X1SLP3_9BACT|nr:hypothetical protein [Blastopirellula sediminis]MCC9605832.1 hypothetical protein [Blastopirellula sediminis]MCC9630869.1 hypothetical protein [Blastopirellula sediminis]
MLRSQTTLKALAATFSFCVVLSFSARQAAAIPFFWEVFEKQYVHKDAADDKAKMFAATATAAKCNVCHVDGQAKKERNPYGVALAETLKKDQFNKERIEKERDKAEAEVLAAFEAVSGKKANDKAKTFGELIAAGELPSAAPDAKPATPMPEPEKKPEEAPKTEEVATLSPEEIAKIKRELRAEMEAELAAAKAALAAAIPKMLDATRTANEIAAKYPQAPIDEQAEAEAIKQITAFGGTVNRIAQSSDAKVVTYHLSDKTIHDEALAPIRKIGNVVEVNLMGTEVTDAGLEQLAGLKQLERLNLAKTKVTDAGLRYLAACEKLNYLNLYGTEVTDAGVNHLYGLPSLRHLYLWQTKATPEGAKQLSGAIPGLKVNLGSM